jgi:hypothetical protein
MTEEVMHCNVTAAPDTELGHELRHLVPQLDFALLDQLEDGRGRELLGERRNLVDGLQLGGNLVFEIRKAVLARDNAQAAVLNEQRDARNMALRHHRRDDRVNARFGA